MPNPKIIPAGRAKAITLTIPEAIDAAFVAALEPGENKSGRVAELMRDDVRKRTGQVIAPSAPRGRPPKAKQEE